jgi:Uma2 family endonuclease
MRLALARSKKYPHSVVFSDVGWPFYKAMLREFDEEPSRINYDRGTLEIMTLSIEHERYKEIIGVMIGMIALTFKLRMTHGGSSTLKRLSKRRGLEADLCYWVANEPLMRTKKRIDLRTDPPPDLVVEIDVMHAVVNRSSIYSALGVPELWVMKQPKGLSAYRLVGKKWESTDRSLSIPFLRVADLNSFVARIGVDDDTSVLADFAEWVKQLRP